MDSQVLKILKIQLIDSICAGLMLPVLNNYIVVALKGTHTTTGFLTSLQLLFQTCSFPVMANTRNQIGNKNALMMITCLMFILNFILIYPQTIDAIVITRCFYSFSNHTPDILRGMLSRDFKQTIYEEINFKLQCLSVAGLIFGSIIGASVYEYFSCFTCVVKLMLILSTINIVICYTINVPEPSNLNDECDCTLATIIKDKYKEAVFHYNSFRMDDHLIFISLKLLTTISLAAFYLKFTLLLRTKFDAKVALIGYTIAYQNAMQFFSNFIVIYVIRYTKRVKLSLIISLTVLLILMVNLMTVETYEGYLIIYIPLILAITFLDRFWQQIYMTENNAKLVQISMVGFEILLPIIFSFFCDLYEFQAMQLACTVPLALAVFISIFYDEDKLKKE